MIKGVLGVSVVVGRNSPPQRSQQRLSPFNPCFMCVFRPLSLLQCIFLGGRQRFGGVVGVVDGVVEEEMGREVVGAADSGSGSFGRSWCLKFLAEVSREMNETKKKSVNGSKIETNRLLIRSLK